MIWKLKIHKSGTLALETRNSELKQVSFSAFNFITGATCFREHEYDESWNLNLAFAGKDNLLLNGYEHAETPESKGIISVSVKDGSIIWQKFNIALNNVQNDGLEVYDPRFQPRRYHWIDHISGETMNKPVAEPLDTDITFPETDNSFTIPSFIQHDILAGELLKLNYRSKIFLSFHEVKNDFLQQRLVVYQGDKVLIDDILISGIQKLQPEAFFIQQNHLFCMKNKREIIAYLL